MNTNSNHLLKFLILTILTFGYFLSHGQTSYGIKVGTNISNLKLESTGSFGAGSIHMPQNKVKLSYAIGGYAEFSVTENLSIMPEILLSSKGARVHYVANAFAGFGGPTIIIENTIRLVYLEFPIYVVHKIPTKSGRVLLKAGPYFGTALSAKIASNMGGKNDKEILKLDFGSSQNSSGTVIRRFDAGLNFSLAYEFVSGFSLNGTYSIGLIDLGDPAPVDPWPNDDFRPISRFVESANRVIRLALAFKL